MLFIVLGLVAVAAAVMGFFRPGVTAVALTWLLGIWLIARGVFEVIGAMAVHTATPRWLLVLCRTARSWRPVSSSGRS